jgi:hypothetical protein
VSSPLPGIPFFRPLVAIGPGSAVAVAPSDLYSQIFAHRAPPVVRDFPDSAIGRPVRPGYRWCPVDCVAFADQTGSVVLLRLPRCVAARVGATGRIHPVLPLRPHLFVDSTFRSAGVSV